MSRRYKIKNIKIKIVDGTQAVWANYSGQFGIWSCFAIDLEIDNFNSKKPDYVNVSLIGKKADGREWSALYYSFHGQYKQNEEVRIEVEEVKRVRVFISDNPISNQIRVPMPEINENGLTLITKTRSRAVFNILIPKANIVRS